MRPLRHLLATCLMVASLSACAAFLGEARQRPEPIANRGLEALEQGDYKAALSDLRWVYTYFSDRPVGQHALLALAAAELDPANPDGSPAGGQELLARFRGLHDTPPWTRPVAASLQRVALTLELTREHAAQAEAERNRLERVARDAGERAAQAAGEAQVAGEQRDTLRARVAELERSLALEREQSEALRRELDRVRRALGD